MAVEPKVHDLAQRSASLSDRLAWPTAEGRRGDGEVDTARLMDRWKRSAAKGRLDLFRRRIARLGLTLEEAEALVTAEPQQGSSHLISEWQPVLAEALERGRAMADRTGPMADYLEASQPVPFEEILAPLVESCRRRMVGEEPADLPERMAPATETAFCRWLLLRLSRQAAPTLMDELTRYRVGHYSSLSLSLAQLKATRDAYDSFVGEMLSGGIEDVFSEYPVLARDLAMITLRAGRFARQVWSRLCADRSLLQSVFGASGRVLQLEPGLSDPHQGLSTVCRIRFESGVVLMYKPRSLAMDEAYQRLIEWMEERESPYRLKAPLALDRGDYGWAEHIASSSVSARRADAFYENAGALLCLLHLLEATDCHRENIVDSVEGRPVLVDCETLLSPRVEQAPHQRRETTSASPRDDDKTVLRTGYLPRWGLGADGGFGFDISGLSGALPRELCPSSPGWLEVNTDTMTRRPSNDLPPTEPVNRTLDRSAIEGLCQGFEHTYRWILANRSHLLAAASPLVAFGEARVRVVFRPTRVYGSLLESATTPARLRSGVERSLHFESLHRAILCHSERVAYWPVVDAEIASLEQLDIPYFEAETKGCDLLSGSDRLVADFTKVSGFAAARANIAAADERDLAYQLGCIRACFTEQADTGSMASNGVTPVGPPLKPISDLLLEASRIGSTIRRRAVPHPVAGKGWIAPRHHLERHEIHPQLVHGSLHDGNGGIALFLSALAAAKSDSRAAESAIDALAPVRVRLEASFGPCHLRGELGIGGYLSPASVVYCCARMGRWLRRPDLFRAAVALAKKIPGDAILEDRRLDVMGGVSGLALALCAVWGETGDRDVLSRARRCGERLVAAAIPQQRGHAWITVGSFPQTGFSHGAAGVVCALLRLGRATGSEQFLEAAARGLEFLQSMFRRSTRDWPIDSADLSQNHARVGWCHGVPGIGLALLDALPTLGSPVLMDLIEASIETTLTAEPAATHSSCCGSFGRIGFLFDAGLALDRPALLARARDLANDALATAPGRSSADHGDSPRQPEGMVEPSFFKGASGIGYQLLRLARPGNFPSVLTLS